MNLLKSTSIYFIGNIINKGIMFLLLPLYTHYLSTKDYGILNIIQSIISILLIFFSMSLNGAARRFHFEGNNLFRKYHYGNIFSYITLFSIIGSIIFYFLGKYILNFIGVPLYPYIVLIIFLTYFNEIFILYQLKLQMEKKPLEFIVNDILRILIFIGFIFLTFFVFLNKNAAGVLEAQLFSFAVLSFYVFNNIFLKKNVILNLNKKIFFHNFKYSIYLIPHNLAGILNSVIDKFFIAKLISISETGIYGLGSQISLVTAIFTVSLNKTLVPVTLKAFKEKNYNYLINLTDITISFITIISLFISLFSNEIITYFFTPEYKKAIYIIPILNTFYLFQMYYFMVVGILFYDKKATKFLPLITITSLFLNIIFNFFFIKNWGMIGAAIATLFSFMIITYLVIFVGKKFIIIKFHHFKIHLLIILEFIVGNLSNHISTTILLKLIIFIFLVLFVILLEINNPLFISLKRKLNEKFF